VKWFFFKENPFFLYLLTIYTSILTDNLPILWYFRYIASIFLTTQAPVVKPVRRPSMCWQWYVYTTYLLIHNLIYLHYAAWVCDWWLVMCHVVLLANFHNLADPGGQGWQNSSFYKIINFYFTLIIWSIWLLE
jgi:hypothetical protein